MKRFSLTLLLAVSGCAFAFDPANPSACRLEFSPSGEAIKAIGEACKEMYDSFQARKLKKIEIVPTAAPTPIPGSVEAETPKVIPTPQPIVITPAPAAPAPGGKAVCTGAQKAPDGGGGFLWKNGDSTKVVVVLLPGRFQKPDSVMIYNRKGKVEKLRFTGHGNPDRDGDRSHWRGSQAVGRYQGKVVAVTGSTTCEYHFKNANRVD